MCYHTKQTKKATEVQKRFNASIENIELFHPTSHFNAFDFPKMPIICNDEPGLIKHWNWGLIPAWSEDDDIKRFTLNARIESIHDKKSFKDYTSQRCLIIANGFYEWKWHDTKGKNKEKFKIGVGEDNLFAFAGLFSEWQNPEDGSSLSTFTMLTTEANELMSDIHNIKKRMPIILKPEDEHLFLEGKDLEYFSFPNYDIDLVAESQESQLRLF